MLDYIWAQKYRPQKLEDLVLSPDHRKLFESWIAEEQIPNILFAGPAGTGKTTSAKILVKSLSCDYLYINASDETGIDTIRSKVVGFSETKSITGGIKVVILDEADGLSAASSGTRSSAQQALRNVMEEYSQSTRFILTANYPSKIMPALHSRCQLVELNPPLQECMKFCINVLRQEGVKIEDGQKKLLAATIKSKYPDIRKILNILQQNTINNKLCIQEDSDKTFIAQKVFKMICAKAKLVEIRTYLIQQESEFQDYHDLLTDLFEVTYSSEVDQSKKASMMLALTEALYRHNQVMDQEINAFGAIIQMWQTI